MDYTVIYEQRGPSAGAVVGFVVGGLVIGPVVAAVHGYGVSLIPMPPVAVAVSLLMPVVAGTVLSILACALKMRGRPLLVAAIVIAVVYQYVLWVAWFYALSERESLTLMPRPLLENIIDVGQHGAYTVGGILWRGPVMFALWAAQALVAGASIVYPTIKGPELKY